MQRHCAAAPEQEDEFDCCSFWIGSCLSISFFSAAIWVVPSFGSSSVRAIGYFIIAAPDTGSKLISSAPIGGVGRLSLFGNWMRGSPALLNPMTWAPYGFCSRDSVLADLRRLVFSTQVLDLCAWAYDILRERSFGLVAGRPMHLLNNARIPRTRRCPRPAITSTGVPKAIIHGGWSLSLKLYM